MNREKNQRSFLNLPGLIHYHNHHVTKKNSVPKGCLAIKVGPTVHEQERFVIPVVYFDHPLFMQLLKEAEKEYGFDHNGPITLPCHVEEFRYVQSIIDRDRHHHNNHQSIGCFRV